MQVIISALITDSMQILGTAVTTNGSALPPNAPLPSAQKQAMIKAFQRANRLPKDVAYFECHATGTPYYVD